MQTSSPSNHHHANIITKQPSPCKHHHQATITMQTSTPSNHHHANIITKQPSPCKHQHQPTITMQTSSPSNHHHANINTKQPSPCKHHHQAIITMQASSPSNHHHEQGHYTYYRKPLPIKVFSQYLKTPNPEKTDTKPPRKVNPQGYLYRYVYIYIYMYIYIILVTWCGFGLACGGSLLHVWAGKLRGFGVSGTGPGAGGGWVNREP